MSLIDPRLECDRCGGYRVPFASTLSSRCRCPDYHPVEPGRHQIGAPPRGPLMVRRDPL